MSASEIKKCGRAPGLANLACATSVVLRDHATVARDLLRYGAQLDAFEQEGRTALMHAVRAGNLHVASVLLDAGAEMHAVDSERTDGYFSCYSNGCRC